MFSETALTIKVSKAYVIKWLALAALLGGAPAIGLYVIMWFYGFNISIAIAAACTGIFLLFILYRKYKRGIKQAIHLHPNKIVFDYIVYTQEFPFKSSGEWKVIEQRGNWKIQSLVDEYFKLVPKSAFPQLKVLAGRFYAIEA